MAEPSDVSLMRFVISQPDLITVLIGVPASWYVAQRRQAALRRANSEPGPNGVPRGATAHAIHSLRQVFAVLLLGTDLLARKAAKLNQPEIEALARRMKAVIRQGINMLAVLGEPHPPDLDTIFTVPGA